jgi:hypothetical protein
MKGTKVERRKMEGMNQFRIQYIYTWKCHNGTPCIAILNKQKSLFFKNRGTGQKNGFCLGAGTSRKG